MEWYSMSGIPNFTYKERIYDQLSEDFKKHFPTAVYAFELIPIIYNRLTLVDKLSHADAFNRICDDHKDLPIFRNE